MHENGPRGGRARRRGSCTEHLTSKAVRLSFRADCPMGPRCANACDAGTPQGVIVWTRLETSSSGLRAGHQRTRLGCTICASIRMLKSVMRLWCDLCGFARSRTRPNDLGSNNLPLRRIHLTPNTKSAPPGGFRSLLQNGVSEGLCLLLFCRCHHVIVPPSHE
jgi:hypothetical protein